MADMQTNPSVNKKTKLIDLLNESVSASLYVVFLILYAELVVLGALFSIPGETASGVML